jgi:hypothetical protein
MRQQLSDTVLELKFLIELIPTYLKLISNLKIIKY